MAFSFVRMLVEILPVNGFETGLRHRKSEQASSGRNHRGGCLRPDILLSEE
jgi:hypothetical protein